MANPILRRLNIYKPPSNPATASIANYAYSSIILVLATLYFLALAIPICLVLVFLLDRKQKQDQVSHYLASVNTKHRWPDELEWSTARKKIISRAKKKIGCREPKLHLTFCPEDWGLSTNVVNIDRANWFMLGLGINYFASVFHRMVLLQCMTGWSVILAKATYEFVMRRPKKPPKTHPTISKRQLKQDYEQWRHFHPSAKVRKRRKPIRSYEDHASFSDEESCSPVSPTKTDFYVDGRLSFAFDPSKPATQTKTTLCCIACSTDLPEPSAVSDDEFTANFGEAEDQHLVGLDNMCSRHLFSAKHDFIGDIIPIDPLEICGVAGGFTAKGEGTVRIRFRNDDGKLVDRKIYKALYAPDSAVRLISITQLARQAPENEITKVTTSRNTTELIWEGEKVTVQHPPPATVPFLDAYLGNPPESYGAFYNSICAFVADTPQRPPYGDSELPNNDSRRERRVTFREPLEISLPEQEEENEEDYKRNSPMEDFQQNLARLRAEMEPYQLPRVAREYLSMHYSLGHLSHTQMQLLVKQGKLPARFKDCSAPACPACIFATQHKRPWRTKGKGGHIRRPTETKPGDGTSTDQMECSENGLVQQSTGNLTRRRIVGATIFVDHVSDFTYPHLMEDLTLNATLVAKEAYERVAATYGVIVKAYHSDNGRYADTGWQDACIAMQQTFSYCGVGQHSQNGIAEKRIRDLSDAVRACLLHAKQRWPEGVCTNLWPFALQYVCNIRNKVRIRENGKTAEEIFAQTDALTGARLENFHPFGCPAYVLEAKLQGGLSKIPRWDPRSRIGVYLGPSPYHAGSVALVLNLTTGHVSPQYHIVFDDDFTTVENLRLGTVPTNWTELNINQTEKQQTKIFS